MAKKTMQEREQEIKRRTEYDDVLPRSDRFTKEGKEKRERKEAERKRGIQPYQKAGKLEKLLHYMINALEATIVNLFDVDNKIENKLYKRNHEKLEKNLIKWYHTKQMEKELAEHPERGKVIGKDAERKINQQVAKSLRSPRKDDLVKEIRAEFQKEMSMRKAAENAKNKNQAGLKQTDPKEAAKNEDGLTPEEVDEIMNQDADKKAKDNTSPDDPNKQQEQPKPEEHKQMKEPELDEGFGL